MVVCISSAATVSARIQSKEEEPTTPFSKQHINVFYLKKTIMHNHTPNHTHLSHPFEMRAVSAERGENRKEISNQFLLCWVPCRHIKQPLMDPLQVIISLKMYKPRPQATPTHNTADLIRKCTQIRTRRYR